MKALLNLLLSLPAAFRDYYSSGGRSKGEQCAPKDPPKDAPK